MITSGTRERLQALLSKALEDQGRGPEVWPEVPSDLLAFLEDAYPPRCYDHNTESVEDHLKYAGAAELVATMRHHHDLAEDIIAKVGEVEVEILTKDYDPMDDES